MSPSLSLHHMIAYKISWLFLLFLCLPLLSYAESSDKVGEVRFSRGAVTVQNEFKGIRLVGKGDDLFAHDVLTTAGKSMAIIELLDGTRMSLRPNTVFRIDELSVSSDHKKDNSTTLSLLKGGFRAVSGFISKRNPNGFKVKTPMATIGIRGTEFDARLCEKDCSDESQRLVKQGPLSVAHIGFMRGKVSALNKQGEERTLSIGSPLYEGDRLTTKQRSLAVIAFNDESRVSLKPNTIFKIEQHQYSKTKPEKNHSVLRLVKGGLRAVSGLIGKHKPTDVKFITPIATIGIRGTGFDISCDQACVDAANVGKETPLAYNSPFEQLFNWLIGSAVAKPETAGLTAFVWGGSIVMQLPNGNLVIGENQAFFIPTGGGQPIQFAVIPASIKDNPAPRPDQVDVQPKSTQEEDVPSGLYLSFYSGKGTVTSHDEKTEPMTLTANQSGFVSGRNGNKPQAVIRLQLQPVFQIKDSIPKANTDVNKLDVLNNLLDDLGGGSTNSGVNCEVR